MFNLDYNSWGSIMLNLIILGAMISSLFIRSTTDRGKKLKNLAIWVMSIFLGVILYNNKYLFKNLIPFVASENTENNSIIIRRSNDNHFYITIKINEKNVLFLIDTGATTTSLTTNDAKRVGINMSDLIYNQPINTANGRTYSASTEVFNVEISNYKLDNLWVLINKDMKGNSLLGMNFLNKLKGYDIRDDRMILYF